MQISGISIGPDHPCRLVAEISNNHNGSLKRAFRLIEAAKEHGADFVKFQCYTPDELVALRGDGPAPDPWGSDGWTMRDLYAKAQTPHAWFLDLAVHCEKVGIPWFSSVFGWQSLELLEAIGCSAYKIAALDQGAQPLTSQIIATGKPVVYSARHIHSSLVFIREAIRERVLALYCPEGYPQDPADLSDLRLIGFDGLSYHGTEWTAAARAIFAGASMLEFHFHLEDEPSLLEANVSLTERDLGQLRQCVARESVSAAH